MEIPLKTSPGEGRSALEHSGAQRQLPRISRRNSDLVAQKYTTTLLRKGSQDDLKKKKKNYNPQNILFFFFTVL